MDTLVLPATAASIDAFHEFVTRKVEHLCLPTELMFDIRLVVEEIVVNIVLHAYPDGEGDVEVGCSVEDSAKLCLTIRDWGVPFNPLEHPPPDLSCDVSERKIGGMGIHLFRRLAHELRYVREDGRNQLNVCFNL